MNLKNAQFNDRMCMFCVKCKKKIKTYLFIVYLGFAPGAFGAP